MRSVRLLWWTTFLNVTKRWRKIFFYQWWQHRQSEKIKVITVKESFIFFCCMATERNLKMMLSTGEWLRIRGIGWSWSWKTQQSTKRLYKQKTDRGEKHAKAQYGLLLRKKWKTRCHRLDKRKRFSVLSVFILLCLHTCFVSMKTIFFYATKITYTVILMRRWNFSQSKNTHQYINTTDVVCYHTIDKMLCSR